jgi:hypothetical protein
MRWRLVPSLLALALVSCAGRTALRPFSSDGCTLFPDGPADDRGRWCTCCQAHDLAYWRGGTEEERKAADEALRECVLLKSRDPFVASLMYQGVRVTGSPVFPAGYRWGYGWEFGRGYEPISGAEGVEARARLAEYRRAHPKGFCAEQ